jgi:hypothetical protein
VKLPKARPDEEINAIKKDSPEHEESESQAEKQPFSRTGIVFIRIETPVPMDPGVTELSVRGRL